MSITINSNISALQAQRRLAQGSDRLARVFERVSSGLRINRAADDAAGLAIADSLRADTRVYAQGMRNINDAISGLQVAEGALRELTGISIRQRELAEQAANGVYTLQQRQALDQEANQLVNEYNRIVASTEFNGIKLFADGGQQISIQAGYGTDAVLNVALGDKLSRAVGTGTFQVSTSVSAVWLVASVETADVNNDGNADLLTVENRTKNTFSVYLGNGNGSFRGGVSYAAGDTPWCLTLADLNGDGFMDAALPNEGDTTVSVYINRGDGTFNTATYSTGSSFDSGSIGGEVTIGDFNEDGNLDLATANHGASDVSILTGRGDGTFNAAYIAYSGTQIANPYGAKKGDFNHDGHLDLVLSYGSVTNTEVLFGNGNGTFKASRVDAGRSCYETTLADINNDGNVDLLQTSMGGLGAVKAMLGNANGTFAGPTNVMIVTTISTGSKAVEAADFNSDGALDLLFRDGDTAAAVSLGNGNGTFAAANTYTVGINQYIAWGAAHGSAVADFTGDGVLDAVVANMNDMSMTLLQQDAIRVTSIANLNLTTVAGARAAMDTIDGTLGRIGQELGAIGAIQSRLGTALNNLAVAKENFAAAESRIMDADVAEESANLIKGQILQQAAAAVLGQANQQPGIALTLLR